MTSQWGIGRVGSAKGSELHVPLKGAEEFAGPNILGRLESDARTIPDTVQDLLYKIADGLIKSLAEWVILL